MAGAAVATRPAEFVADADADAESGPLPSLLVAAALVEFVDVPAPAGCLKHFQVVAAAFGFGGLLPTFLVAGVGAQD